MRGRRSTTGKAQKIFWMKQVARQACLAPTISKSENFLQRRMWQLIRPRNRFTHAISGLDLGGIFARPDKDQADKDNPVFKGVGVNHKGIPFADMHIERHGHGNGQD